MGTPGAEGKRAEAKKKKQKPLSSYETASREPEDPDPKWGLPERHEFLQCKISGSAENEVDEMNRRLYLLRDS